MQKQIDIDRALADADWQSLQPENDEGFSQAAIRPASAGSFDIKLMALKRRQMVRPPAGQLNDAFGVESRVQELSRSDWLHTIKPGCD